MTMNNKEIYIKIKGLNNYYVSNLGNIKSIRGNILKQQLDSKGYCRISITENKVKKTYKVHRIVAETFIDNPLNKEQVNHIDGNKQNNRSDNLEWCTNKENCIHAIQNGLWENVFIAPKKANDKKKIKVIAFKGNHKIYFESIGEAERYFNSKHISDVLYNKRKTVKGYSFIKGGDACVNK